MTPFPEDRSELLAQVAHLYFEQGLNQGEIAEQFHVSRASVSRLIAEARELGIVEIWINFPLARQHELEQSLSERFGLQSCYVLDTKKVLPAHTLGRLGRLASLHLSMYLSAGSIVGLSWGTAVYETVQALRRRQLQDIKVVQVIGASGTANPLIDGPDLARQLAERLGGQYFYLHAPLLVEDSYVRDRLLASPHMQLTLSLARQSTVLLIGIGSTNPEISPLLRAGYISEAELAELAGQGAVGDFCGYHIDTNGRLLDHPINERVVGIPPEDLLAVPHRVGVAGGVVKAPSILGALRGKLIHALITDDHAAREVLRQCAD